MTDNHDRPAYLLVVARVTDRAKMAAYAKALADSGLYARHGGFYRFIGAGDDMEGWGGESVVCAEFPSRAAAQAFWTSDEYQTRIKPLRDGAGEFRVAIFDAAPPLPGQAAHPAFLQGTM